MIITITNQKGGCGKTTTAHSMSAGLAKRGFKVLAIDTDPQTNFSYASGITKPEGDIFDVLTGAKTAEEVIAETGSGFDIIPGSIYLVRAEAELKNADGKPDRKRLQSALQAVSANYDYCVVDTPPQLGIITANALTASDCVIIPMGADIFSLQGLAQLQGMINMIPGLYIDGLLLTRFSPRTIVNRQLKKDLERVANRLNTRVYKAHIREATAVKEVQLMKTDLFSQYPKANVTKDYSDFIDEFLKGRKDNGKKE